MPEPIFQIPYGLFARGAANNPAHPANQTAGPAEQFGPPVPQGFQPQINYPFGLEGLLPQIVQVLGAGTRMGADPQFAQTLQQIAGGLMGGGTSPPMPSPRPPVTGPEGAMPQQATSTQTTRARPQTVPAPQAAPLGVFENFRERRAAGETPVRDALAQRRAMSEDEKRAKREANKASRQAGGTPIMDFLFGVNRGRGASESA